MMFGYLSVQPLLDDEDGFSFDDRVSQQKWIDVTNGTDFTYTTAKDVGVKTAFGTDILFDPALAEGQGAFLAKLQRWYTPFEVLEMATSIKAELLELAGPRHPYQAGPLGQVAEGAYADPRKNFDLIMKDRVIYKMRLNRRRVC